MNTANQLLIARVMREAVEQRRKKLATTKRLNNRASMIATELETLADDCVAEGLDPSMVEACLIVRCNELLDRNSTRGFRAAFSFDEEDD